MYLRERSFLYTMARERPIKVGIVDFFMLINSICGVDCTDFGAYFLHIYRWINGPQERICDNVYTVKSQTPGFRG